MINKQLLISFCLLLFLVFKQFHLCFSLDLYSECSSKKYRCGSISDVDFPFWGEDRPEYCGHPKLKLSCEENNATIQIKEIKYQVLEIEKVSPVLKIARVDFLNNGLCSPQYGNSTLDTELFEYAGPSEDITIFYGCNYTSGSIFGWFDCNPTEKAFILPGNSTTLKNNGDDFSCRSRVTVRVSDPVSSYRDFMNSSLIEENLKEGYPVEYKVDFEACEKCRNSSGVCGYDLEVNRTTCYCRGDQSPGLKDVCASPPESGGTQIGTPTNSDNEQYIKCNNTPLNCGDKFKNLGYPFWGEDRPAYCGHPDFELNCSGEAPELTIDSFDHRVIEIKSDERKLTVVRDEYWNNTCSDDRKTATLNTALFRYGVDTQNLTLYYRCPSSVFTEMTKVPFQFSCSGDTTGVTNFFATESMRSASANIPSCGKGVVLRILDSAATKLETPNLTLNELSGAINSGFGIEWNANNSFCDECLRSEGVCGSDDTTRQFKCYCRDRAYNARCGSDTFSATPSEPKKETSKVVGLSIAGACILGMFIGGFTYYLILRRKRRAAIAKSKDLSAPPSSKSLITSSTNFSRSTPTDSYALSKSDIEKGSTYFGTEVFSYTELEEATDNFDPSKELGEGGFGTVYYGKLRDGRVVAVKRLYENNFKRVEQFMNEVKILTGLGHQNLVKLFGCTSRRSRELLLVYEFIPNGTVADHLHGKQSTSCVMSWPVRLSIAIETADALAYLHRSEIIHRDVKTNNILLDNEFRVKVADFGLSRLFPTDVTHVSTAPQGTPGYVDPEYYQCYQLTDKSDVYSFGVVLVELISSLQAVDTNRHRHDINLANMAITRIQNHAVNELVDPSLGFDKDFTIRKMTTAVAELAFRCLQQEKDMRPSMEEVVAVLRAIKNEEFIIQKADVVDIRSDDMGLLKNLPPPLSPDSVVNEKYVSNSTTPNSY
ncbi:LEAF RUST 10 DISEASE-RESISTANCE LOCUS RECEPTOR-LIKE PROTEIN KINASE-like 1.4 [Humulus lupulus]|uniref:LEAF RUST 10 DISEASE-RESISTANCE LOCUS RECEPTOR-LIKE PROTEIN KINASE-like 1.4 n=1 Tax=Humulus lupulus TaxID=3486 RepID=UPI002B40436A|nr:LEAF RUST 10 DISEASE-RESISTANCE LOCUS RECEPTOR-LIKE PROTEIN KINASE-like 1.4 [Humulus lupulus]